MPEADSVVVDKTIMAPSELAELFSPHLCSGCLANGYEWLIDRPDTHHAFHDDYFLEGGITAPA